MRTLPPLKAIFHALNSVYTYRAIGIRLGLKWVLVLWGLGLIRIIVENSTLPAAVAWLDNLLALAAAIIGLVGFCSIAVGWHRFVLRDEVGPGLRVDEPVWHYICNSLLITLAVLLPILVLAVIVNRLPAVASILVLPAAMLAGLFALRLSVKLPAVALGRKDFGMADALAASDGNFWQLMAVLLLNAIVVLAALFALIWIVDAIAAINPVLASLIGLSLGMVLQLFYTLFNASIFTSLYGFFVEKREF